MDREYIYQTKFFLKAEVLSIEDANNYLQDEDMTKYLKADFKDIADDIINIKWSLVTNRYGTVTLITNRELDNDELKSISKWINGQNSDGIGEGFEQQDFASYTERDEIMYDLHQRGIYSIDLGESEDEPDDSYLTVCSFDWRNNDYELELIN